MNALADMVSRYFNMLLNIAKSFAFNDLIDILIVAVLFYAIIRLLRETRVGQLMKGLLFLVVVYFLAAQLEMVMVKSILQNVFSSAVLVLIILFQPEIRKALEQMGRSNVGQSIVSVFSGRNRTATGMDVSTAIDGVVEATALLQQMRMGALIVFELKSRLNEVVNTGTLINALPSPQLIANIFFNKAPLHDGAMIIRNGKVFSAGCILPLTSRDNVSSELGTRHRAALGISEDTDALVVVVSEETGQISVAEKGKLTRNYTRVSLRELLVSELMYEHEEKTGGIWSKWKNLWKKSDKDAEKGDGKQSEEESAEDR